MLPVPCAPSTLPALTAAEICEREAMPVEEIILSNLIAFSLLFYHNIMA